MKHRVCLVALAVLAAAAAAQAQPSPAPAQPAEQAADEPIDTARSNEESVVVTGARPVPITPPERIMTNEQRRRHQAESRCIVAAQDATDPNRVNLTSPEEACRQRAP